MRILASDDFNGRNNQTPGSAASRDLLVSVLSEIAAPAVPDGDGGLGFLQEYALGTNIVGVIAGRGALANEYVMIGAHYDHLGPGECDTLDERDDVICNGAADNAAGVASVMDLAGRVHRDPGGETDRRGLVVAFWDGEEDGLVGARRYVADPVIPLGQITTYVNFDIQGASLLPALSNHTLLIGAETGGAALSDVASRASDASPLEYTLLSVFFGQSRSDHAPFVDAGVPALFFTDGDNGCYHTVLDDVDHYDGDKHLLQIDTAETAVRELLGASDSPEFVGDGPRTTFDDAVELLELVKAGGEELALLPDRGVATVDHLVALDRILGAGPEAYDAAAEERVLTGASDVGAAFTNSACRRP